ncbi:hypothetical protein FRAHR75_170098 [Frankia sp. Hr75.2]|nr:hypothetical protein FRAHR75_170098 [Frankia sp. Hr75.2]
MAVVGTGSTGVQAIPVVAEQAAHLYVFQRSAAYTLPSPARAYEPGEFEGLRARYDEIRAAQRAAHVGAARTSAFSVLVDMAGFPALRTASREEQPRAVEERGVLGALYRSDVLVDSEAGRLATALYGEAVARIVRDPRTAASLVPTYPFGCKRRSSTWATTRRSTATTSRWSTSAPARSRRSPPPASAPGRAPTTSTSSCSRPVSTRSPARCRVSTSAAGAVRCCASSGGTRAPSPTSACRWPGSRTCS